MIKGQKFQARRGRCESRLLFFGEIRERLSHSSLNESKESGGNEDWISETDLSAEALFDKVMMERNSKVGRAERCIQQLLQLLKQLGIDEHPDSNAEQTSDKAEQKREYQGFFSNAASDFMEDHGCSHILGSIEEWLDIGVDVSVHEVTCNGNTLLVEVVGQDGTSEAFQLSGDDLEEIAHDSNRSQGVKLRPADSNLLISPQRTVATKQIAELVQSPNPQFLDHLRVESGSQLESDLLDSKEEGIDFVDGYEELLVRRNGKVVDAIAIDRDHQQMWKTELKVSLNKLRSRDETETPNT